MMNETTYTAYFTPDEWTLRESLYEQLADMAADKADLLVAGLEKFQIAQAEGFAQLAQLAQLTEMLRFANAAASVITTRKGALKVMPSADEVKQLLNQ